ncbi:hypothetical protein BGX38DRAFT_1196230 [Terfezia claveryi]|nr:hypothetical protein BGX38DRAFT_1243043 [Terfezia claveryi]KAF8445316.1 hypothetical protein BGX38DRAFT_1196230 [Terfezia claveryi]
MRVLCQNTTVYCIYSLIYFCLHTLFNAQICHTVYWIFDIATFHIKSNSLLTNHD